MAPPPIRFRLSSPRRVRGVHAPPPRPTLVLIGLAVLGLSAVPLALALLLGP